MRRPWSFWLTCLLLAALPLKGLAAAGVALCCPQAAAVAAPGQPAGAHAGHQHADAGAPAAQADTASTVASPGDLLHAAHDGGSHGDAKLSPCCAAAVVSAPAVWRADAGQAAAPPLWRDRPYRSAWLPGIDRPPSA
ncbi:MAG TPA: hypothetical protein PLZ13_16375 [Ottowia sp.]|nr:hypothetical protein [Ottowia sp.]